MPGIARTMLRRNTLSYRSLLNRGDTQGLHLSRGHIFTSVARLLRRVLKYSSGISCATGIEYSRAPPAQVVFKTHLVWARPRGRNLYRLHSGIPYHVRLTRGLRAQESARRRGLILLPATADPTGTLRGFGYVLTWTRRTNSGGDSLSRGNAEV